MAPPPSTLVKAGVLFCGTVLVAHLNGCATATSGLECGMESLHPTVMATVDSFESAALAIKLSNQVLLEMPINEQDSWPDKLYGVPSGGNLLMMGVSLFGASQGITLPFAIDPVTGLPRPTSALYLFLNDREEMLRHEANEEDVQFFRMQPANVIARELPLSRRRPNEQLIDEHIYRNPLMAFGVVTANQEEMLKVQQDIDLISQGFKRCDAWVHGSQEGQILPAACKDPALQQVNLETRMRPAPSLSDRPSDLAVSGPWGSTGTRYVDEKDRQLTEKRGELEVMRKNYGKLAGRVYTAAVAGADFTTASLLKIGCAIANGSRALSNIKNEFRGARGVYNLAMVISRVRMIINALGYYQKNLTLQFTAYRTMYQQIKGTYPDLQDNAPDGGQQDTQALRQIDQATVLFKRLAPKFELALQGLDAHFSDNDLAQLTHLAQHYTDRPSTGRQMLLAGQQTDTR